MTEYSILSSVLLASLFGSLHCVGMCGGFVAVCSSSACTRRFPQSFLPQASYHLMRLVSYTLLGTIAGYIGHAANIGSSYIGYQQMFGVIAGSMLVLWGLKDLGLLGKFPGTIKLGIAPHITQCFRSTMNLPPILRGALLGFFSGILPCGWLYAFVISAAATGDPISGAAIMAAFWLGTVPALVAFGTIVQKLNQKVLAFLPRLAAIIILTLGLLTITGKLTPTTSHSHISGRCH